MTSITYIIGTRDAGKTSLLKEVIAIMPQCIGVIADKCLDSEGYVTGYDAVLIPSGKRLPHCRRFQDQTFTQRHGGFFFDQRVFGKVQAYILEHFDPKKTVIIDEIGSLEMRHQQGYYPILEALMQEPELSLILALRG